MEFLGTDRFEFGFRAEGEFHARIRRDTYDWRRFDDCR